MATVLFPLVPNSTGDPSTSFTFTANAGEANPPPETVTLSGAASALPITRVSPDSNQSLLSFVGSPRILTGSGYPPTYWSGESSAVPAESTQPGAIAAIAQLMHP